MVDRAGDACRFAYKVFDPELDAITDRDGLAITLRETDVARQQLKALFFEDGTGVATLAFQRFTAEGERVNRECFTLRGEEITQLRLLLRYVTSGSLGGHEDDDEGLRIETAALVELARHGPGIAQLLEEYQPIIEEFFLNDEAAPDIVAVARRREQLDRFRKMITDDEAFHGESRHYESLGAPHGPERTWQSFFEENRWVFGAGLAPQFLESFDPDRLEQSIIGASIFEAGHRPDAVMRSSGVLGALVLVEIKGHQTRLLAGKPYRSGAWAPTAELSGAVAQCQAAVDAAVQGLGGGITVKDADGYAKDWIAVARPRCLLVGGSLDEFRAESGVHREKYESFERYRRSLRDPEVITFDELYERARLSLSLEAMDPG